MGMAWAMMWGGDVSLADSVPPPESSGAAGNGALASRWDHSHPRLTSAVVGVLNASGEASITFTRTFDTQPCVDCTYVEASDNPPIIFKVKSWTTDGNGKYTGCVIKGYRGQTLPASIALLSALISFNVFAGAAPAGIPFTCIALQQST